MRIYKSSKQKFVSTRIPFLKEDSIKNSEYVQRQRPDKARETRKASLLEKDSGLKSLGTIA